MIKTGTITILLLLIFFTGCDKTTINNYEIDDPDNYYGAIVGKILQKDSQAKVIINQEIPIDSTTINPIDGTFKIENIPVGNYDLVIRGNNFRIYKLLNVLVNEAASTYVGEIDLSTLPDLVSRHHPENLEEIAFNNNFHSLTISIIFTQPMDRESVEKAFSTEPTTDGIFYWGIARIDPIIPYYFSDSDWLIQDKSGTITTFSKVSSFSYRIAQKDTYVDTTYNVLLSTLATDTSGNNLRFPLEFSFSTVQSSSTLHGIQTSPYDGDINVDLISNNGIQISFPRNMNQSSTEQAITVMPQNNNIYIWPADNKLTIYTGGLYYADTTYQVSIDSIAKDLDGNKLGKQFSFSFDTAPVQLTNAYPRNGQLFVDTNSHIELQFNTYISKSSVEKAFSIQPEISGEFRYGQRYSSNNDNKRYITFDPSESFEYNTKYTINIGLEARDLFDSNIKEPYTFSFITEPE